MNRCFRMSKRKGLEKDDSEDEDTKLQFQVKHAESGSLANQCTAEKGESKDERFGWVETKLFTNRNYADTNVLSRISPDVSWRVGGLNGGRSAIYLIVAEPKWCR